MHDGVQATQSCPASQNNIMSSVIGAYLNISQIRYFSNCSVNSIQSNLLTPNMEYI
jgi:hypothetical protein